jgi:hypothetical protein
MVVMLNDSNNTSLIPSHASSVLRFPRKRVLQDGLILAFDFLKSGENLTRGGR